MAREFGLTPALTGLVGSAIMIGTIFGSLIGGWLTDKIGRYQVFMADMLFSWSRQSRPGWRRTSGC